MPRKKSSGHSITEGIDLRNKQKAMVQILERLETLTDKSSGREVSELFMELPNRDDYPDYYLAIKNPVALETVKMRVEQGEYKGDSFAMFGKDLKTLTANAKSYNRHGSIIYKDALTLEKSIEEALGVLYSDKEAVVQEPFSMAYCNRVWKSIRTHKDKGGRLVSELFWELPSREDYPDYYQEIARPMALDGIKRKIEGREYKSLQDFENDFDLMFANAKQYNTEGSGVYLDAEELQELFWKTIGKENVKPVRRPNSASSSNPLKRQKDQSSFTYQGETYRIGDFVHLRSGQESSDIVVGLIVGLWENSGQHGFDATWFLRPDQFEHPYASQFSETEVVKAIGSHEHLETHLIDKCFVLYPSVYVKGRPVQWKEGQRIYVCDQRYNAKKDTVTKIKNWPSVFPKGFILNEVKLKFYPEPLVITKLPSTATVRRPVNKEPEDPSSRQSTPSDTSVATTPSLTPTTPTPASNASRKRKSANISDLSSPSAAPSSQRNIVRCNYSNLATGTPCAGTFPSIQELQRHVAAEHAIIQNVKAPPILKRGRPKKNALADSAESSPQPQDTTVASIKSQQHSMQGLGQSPQEIMSQFDNAARPASLASSAYPASYYASHQAPTGYQNMPYTQAHQMGHSGMGYQSSYGQQQSFSGEPRPQGYTQTSPYGQTYPQHYSGQQQRVYAQQHYDQTQIQRHSTQDYTNNSYYTTPPYSYQQQYSQQSQAYGYPYHTEQPHHLQVASSAQYGGLSQYAHAQTSQVPVTQQRPQAVQTQRPSGVQQAQVYPSTTRTQGHLGYQPDLVVQSQSLPVSSTATAQTLYPNQYHHNPQQHQYQQHTRAVSGSSAASTPSATSTRAVAMEGAGLGLSGVTISDHARVAPTTTADGGYSGISASSTVTSTVGSFGQSSGIGNGHAAWSGPSDMGTLHYAPEYVVKRQKQDTEYVNAGSTVAGSGAPSVDGTLNGYGNSAIYSAQVPPHSGHGHTFSTSSMESVITSHQGTGGNQSTSAPAYSDMTR
ncbi:hypothetical protein CPB97_007298 [Podila verticillata]|nr:hypothetical protein CPB97_007298 [Podila verticillata]